MLIKILTCVASPKKYEITNPMLIYFSPAVLPMCRVWWWDPRPVYPEGGPEPRVARGLPQVHGVPDVSWWKLYLLCQRRKDLLQEGLRQVRRPHLRNGGPSGSGASTRTHTESDSMLEFKLLICCPFKGIIYKYQPY